MRSDQVVLGIGTDAVHLPSFAAQLEDGASSFVVGTFTEGERALAGRRAESGAEDEPARCLGARFAAKEAFIKAWSGARWGLRPRVERPDLREIEVIHDAWGRPGLRFHGAVAAGLAELGPARAHLSLTHDGPVASAFVVLAAEALEEAR